MKNVFCFLLLLPLGYCAIGQTYADSIAQYRKQYIADLLADKRSPIKPSQVNGINFFKADRSYCVWGAFKETPGSVPFMIDTHSAKKKPFREYGTVTFVIHDSTMTLHIYQSIDLVKVEGHQDDLFIPFNDMTNYDATYGGGRYLDLSIKDIKDGMLLLDFNKCYNPYCAYADGYSCPIPPVENRLPIEISAGERMFTPGM
jgi:uncharacterized protein (DUF1684 family)